MGDGSVIGSGIIKGSVGRMKSHESRGSRGKCCGHVRYPQFEVGRVEFFAGRSGGDVCGDGG